MANESVFRKTLPITLVTLVNRCADNGINLLPMLLVERAISTRDSSFLLGLMKSFSLVAPILSGFLCDRLGYRLVLLLAFLFSGVGLASLPYAHTFLLLAFTGLLAHVGQGLFTAPSRMYLIKLVSGKARQEALGWFRTASNGAQLIASTISAAFSSFGLAFLFRLDALSSFFAFFATLFLIPSLRASKKSEQDSQPTQSSNGNWKFFICMTLVTSLYMGSYMFGLTVAAARARIVFGEEGIRIYAWMMMINTAICMLLGVYASKIFKNIFGTILLGTFLTTLGVALVVAPNISKYHYLVGSFIFTAGEVIYASVAQYTLMTAIPKSKNENSIYSFALSGQNVGRILGVSVAFPLGVANNYSIWVVGICFVAMITTMIYAKPFIQRHHSVVSS